MNDLTIFKDIQSLQLLNYEKNDFEENAAASTGTIAGMPILHIDGKSFTLVIDGEKIAIGASIQGVIVGVGAIAKRFYKNTFTGEELSAPDCASANGITPDSAIAESICDKCAMCPNNAWGSKASLTGKHAKACKDYRRIVIHIPTDNATSSSLYRLDVPAASLKPLSAYSNRLSTAGIPLSAVRTKIGFDIDAIFPKLTFDAVLTLNAETYEKIKMIKQAPEIQKALTFEIGFASIANEEAPSSEPRAEKETLKKQIKTKKNEEVEKTNTLTFRTGVNPVEESTAEADGIEQEMDAIIKRLNKAQ